MALKEETTLALVWSALSVLGAWALWMAFATAG